MTKWIADFEVESHASLSQGGNKLIYNHPSGEYEVHISDLSVGPGLEKQLLSFQLIFEEADIKLAYDKAKSLLNSFLDLLSLVTNLSFKIGNLLRIIDWSKGLKMRKAHQFTVTPDPQIPFPILDNQTLKNVSILSANDIPRPVRRALTWYALGIKALYSDDQFQLFWFALEVLAQFKKSTDEVADLCPRCKTELYCKTCDAISTHRPYPKQAIKDLILKTVRGDPEKAFDIVNAFRNCLLHGDEVEKVEKQHKISLNNAVDVLGKTVWAALISSFKAPKTKESPLLIVTNTYGHKEMVGTADVELGGSPEDVNNPKIEHFRGLKVEVQYHEGPIPDDKKNE